MASIYKHGGGWRAQVRRGDERDSRAFRTKQEAAQWALQREAEMTGARLPDKTWGDALTKFAREVSPSRGGSRWELVRLEALGRDPIAKRKLASLAGEDFAQWRDKRLTEVKPATVAREMNLIRAVLKQACSTEWKWLRASPLQGVKSPKSPSGRKRRISQDEIDRITLACKLDDGLAADTAMQRVGLAFLLALETAMRSGEMMAMRWRDVAEKSVHLPKTKNGDERTVPLSKRAREIIATLPRTDGSVFALDDGTRDTLWRRAVAATKIPNLHFHDSRAEAIWRLSKKLDVLELARVIGHRDINSLLIYYQADADDLADRL